MCAWRCSGKTNEELIKNLAKAGILKKRNVIEAMSQVDRRNYVREMDSSYSYEDRPLGIGYNATISAPHMHAHALEELESVVKPKPGRSRGEMTRLTRVLDIGFGSGYLTACLAVLAGPSSIVYGVEHIPELVSFGKDNIRRDQPGLIEQGRIVLQCSDGRIGLATKGPFDAIHVGAHIETPPKELLSQVKVGGRIFIPAGNPQQIFSIQRVDETEYEWTGLDYVQYIPLTSRDAQVGNED